MRLDKLHELAEKGFLSEDDFRRLEPLVSGRVVSLFYELRIVLYLGVMLFTTGVGILIYKNIGDVGHMLAIIGLSVLTVLCFAYVLRFAQDYSNESVSTPTPYYDYIVLLGCLLFISVLTYLQIRYDLFDDGMGGLTLATAAFFFYGAYRFDHLGVLSLAITALASFFSISIAPEKWYSDDFLETADLHIRAMIFGSVLSAAALALERKGIKKHFTFTFLNFTALIYLAGSLAGVLMDDDYIGLYMLLLYAGCALAVWQAHRRKSFLFLLYAFIFGYIGTTAYLADTVLDDPWIWFFYLLLSCGGFIFFVVRFRNYFKREA